MTATELDGLWVPLITPFDERGELDGDALARLAGEVLGAGATGLVLLGTTGEPATLTATERRRVVEIGGAVADGAGRPYIVGVGSNATAATIAEVRAITSACAPAALLVVVPYYTRPSEAGVVEHLAAVAEASPAPVVVYNVPYRTGVTPGRAAMARIARLDNVAGVKQAVGSLDVDTLALLADRPDGFAVLCGDDALVAPMTLLGGAGAIAASAHVCTGRFAAMAAAASCGDAPTAAADAAALLPVVDAGFAEPSPAVWKGALHAQGRIASPRVRRPLTEASPAAVAALLDAVAAADCS